MPKDSAKDILTQIKGYFRENWGTPFIIGFVLLLIVSAAYLSNGLNFLADEVGIYAYYALVAGIVLQLACFLKYGERSGNKD